MPHPKSKYSNNTVQDCHSCVKARSSPGLTIFVLKVTGTPTTPAASAGHLEYQNHKRLRNRKRPLTKPSGYDIIFHINLKVFSIEIVIGIEKK